MPELHVDTQIIGQNAEEVARLLRGQGIDLVGVTKGCLGEPAVGAAMLAGGAVALADTRDRNLRRLRDALPHVELQRIYLPSVRGPFEPGDVTHVSSVSAAVAVAACASAGTPRRVMISLETGDVREGVPAELLADLARRVSADSRLRLVGLSTNYACFQGSSSGIRASVEAVARAARELRGLGLEIPRVSGGNSSVLALVLQGVELPEEVTELRCGEALLLGQEALSYRPIPGCGCACTLRAEVLEEYTKPPHSDGRMRLVLGLGRQDLASGAVRFCDPDLSEVGRSGDYLVVEAGRECAGYGIGTDIDMIPSYEALVAAWTSPYVELRLR
jgi:predicted amino acid racemase